MKKTAKRAAILWFLVIAFFGGVIFLCSELAIHGSTWAANRANRHIYNNGTIVNTGAIYDRNGVMLAESVDGEREYAEDASIRKAVLHVLGDASGVISTGTHNIYKSLLSGYDMIFGVYNLKHESEGASITLNIDSEANVKALEALNGYKGTVIVCNYKTGELLCSVSTPTYDVMNVPDDLRTNSKYDGVFLDRAVSAKYTPGSIMKIVTAICAIENIPDIYNQTFECSYHSKSGTDSDVGSYYIGSSSQGGYIKCNGLHGTVTFEEALNDSCNCAFADIALQLGAKKLKETAESLGFNQSLSAKEVPLTMSSFNPPSDDKLELGWAGIGQSTTTVNPMHFLTIINAIANGGKGIAPDRIKEIGGIKGYIGRTTDTMVTISPDTASAMTKLLRSNVVNKYGDDTFPGLQMCGKTGTAEITGQKKSNAAFVGFSQTVPLSVFVYIENIGGGQTYAAPIANELLQYFASNYTFS